jgi:hypothetical protein
MKVRSGFVSNSSSSSFVIFVREANINEIDNEHVKVYLGSYGDGAGYDRPTPEMIEFLKANSSGDYKLYYEYASFGEEADLNASEMLPQFAKMVLTPPKEKVLVKSFSKSYYFPESLSEFKEAIGVD